MMNQADPHGAPGTMDVHPVATFLIGVAVVLIAALEFYLLCALWPLRQSSSPKDWDLTIMLFGHRVQGIPLDVRFLWLVGTAAALGSYVHLATSFADYVGNKSITKSWLLWYVLRTPIGVALGVFFYFLLRAGLLTTNGGVSA